MLALETALIAIVNIVSFNANVTDFMNIELKTSSHHLSPSTPVTYRSPRLLSAGLSLLAAASAALGCFYEEIKQKSTLDQTDNVVYRQIGAALTIALSFLRSRSARLGGVYQHLGPRLSADTSRALFALDCPPRTSDRWQRNTANGRHTPGKNPGPTTINDPRRRQRTTLA